MHTSVVRIAQAGDNIHRRTQNTHTYGISRMWNMFQLDSTKTPYYTYYIELTVILKACKHCTCQQNSYSRHFHD
jgi:hypothetical protein